MATREPSVAVLLKRREREDAALRAKLEKLDGEIERLSVEREQVRTALGSSFVPMDRTAFTAAAMQAGEALRDKPTRGKCADCGAYTMANAKNECSACGAWPFEVAGGGEA